MDSGNINGENRLNDANGALPPLNQIYFYLTEGCNLACRHCWLAPKLDKTGNQYPTLPVTLFEVAIQEAKPLGLKGVKLTGGEPILHPHFTYLLEIIRRENLSLTIETNGVLCTPDIAAEIASCSTPSKPFVSISLDGTDAETHEWVRGVKGSFMAAQEGIKNLVSVGLKPQVILSVMKKNASQVEDIIRLAEALGAGSVKFNVIQPTARGEKLHASEETLNIRELIELGYHVERELSKKTNLKLIYSFPSAFKSLGAIANDGCGICGIKGIIGVLASGHWALCGIGETVPELIYGKVGKDPLEKVWKENPTILSIREGLPMRLKGVCNRCIMKHRCIGSCVAQNYYRTEDLFEPFWFCEEAEKAGLFPGTRLIAN